MEIKRGQVWNVDLGNEHKGSIQCGTRPCLIIQNNMGNKYSPCLIVACITSKPKTSLPTHVDIQLKKPSTILCEQIFTINKKDLIDFVCDVNSLKMRQINKALSISLGLD